ncbi:MAG: thermonuclease family protein [Alphaproteobacteria bacterium]|nr:thermonuclease family protein [Alphaproteobacteria bacterium]
MAKSNTLSAGLAVFAIIFAAALSYIALSADPASRAEAQTTQLVSADSSARSGVIAGRVRVVDGDTIEDMNSDITYRLVNIDTAETGSRARCTAERDLGDRAKEAVRTLVAGARRIELNPTGRIDRYGRTIAFVVIDGRDMGETLMAEGLARPWRGRREPWCDASGNLIP